MRRRLCLLALVLAVYAVAGQASAQDIPPRPPPSEGLVIDRAGLLARAERQALNQKLVAFNDSTSTQIVVVILPTLAGADAEQFATALGQQWGVGQGATDNGVVFLVSVEDRQVFIATGYGLEGAIPDAVAGRIVRRLVVPSFRQGQYYGGIAQATDAIMAAATGEYTAEPRGSDGSGDGVPLALVVVILVIVVALISAARDEGGGRGGNGGRTVRRRRSGMPPVIIFPGGWGGGHQGGGGWGGGGFGGGGFGGGGFGGFGGGGFGGGGAGGGW